MQFSSLTPFVLISFGMAWGILGLYILLPELMGAAFGQLTGNHALFFLAVYAPAIAAFTVVARNGGIAGLRRFLGRALLWRCDAAWYAFLIIGMPLIFIGGSAIRGNLFTGPFPFPSFRALLVALVLAAVKGPVEEFGWRGLALPLLQMKFAPIWAGLILGAIWGLWHLPAFLLSGTQQSEWSFTAFFSGCLAISVIATALFNRSREHSVVRVLPLLAHEPDLSRRAALRHAPADCFRPANRVVEPQEYVHNGRICHRSHSARKSD